MELYFRNGEVELADLLSRINFMNSAMNVLLNDVIDVTAFHMLCTVWHFLVRSSSVLFIIRLLIYLLTYCHHSFTHRVPCEQHSAFSAWLSIWSVKCVFCMFIVLLFSDPGWRNRFIILLSVAECNLTMRCDLKDGRVYSEFHKCLDFKFYFTENVTT